MLEHRTQFGIASFGELVDGIEAGSLAGKPQVVDSKVGDGHVVSFAIRPFWRWQTQGTFFLGFNAILNWNDLNAGKAAPAEAAPAGGGGRR